MAQNANKHPYGWLSPLHARRLGAFLASPSVTEADQLFLVGDTLDLWVCPHDVQPPTAKDIITAAHNKPIVDGLRKFAASSRRRLFYILGNHDLAMTAGLARELAPQIVFMNSYNSEFPLRVSHGHENSLFNSPDPMGRDVPLGYFITRFVATAAREGLGEVGMNWRTILGSGPEIVALLEHHPLAECVFDAVRKAAGIGPDAYVKMPDGSERNVSDLRATYQNLLGEWNERRKSRWQSALLCEYDPFYDHGVGTPHLYIAGHSHDRVYTYHASYGTYMNLGAWCGSKAYFGKTWIENADERTETLCGRLYEWSSETGEHAASTCMPVPTH
ncbi:MAG TPA: hypothetical protein VFK02_23975 [Kofleriaceae bacterium]|nr:hypothetical protein [Kofleriaceae bacterium]